MSRKEIDKALDMADSVTRKKRELINANKEIFDQIIYLDDLLKDQMNIIYNSPELTEYDTVTINQATKLENALNSSVKLGLDENDPMNACSNHAYGMVKVLFIDAESLSEATRMAYSEDMKDLYQFPIYVSDGSAIRFWDGNGFDGKFLEWCKM